MVTLILLFSVISRKPHGKHHTGAHRKLGSYSPATGSFRRSLMQFLLETSCGPVSTSPLTSSPPNPSMC